MPEGRKTIPQSRDRRQSRALVWFVGSLLALFSFVQLKSLLLLAPQLRLEPSGQLWIWLSPWIVSLTFALLVWAVRAATFGGILFGSTLCLSLTLGTRHSGLWHSGLAPLVALFVLTFAATKAGRHRKMLFGLAEDRRGRNAAQVLANLGVAGLIAIAGFVSLLDNAAPFTGYLLYSAPFTAILVTAALAQATADTVSSELGQAFGGTPFLFTTLRPVPPGTDGAISLLGTAAGIAGAILVALTGMWAMHLTLPQTAIALTSAIAGLFFDSLLGATLERRGWLGNDLVNFLSTAFAALTALALLLALHLLSHT
jgi:uncharacterized protein (TIGR00297 family)